MATEGKPQGKRGFASMSPEKRREIASKGGKSVAKEKRSFTLNRAWASEAGRMGGLATPGEKRAFAIDQELAARAGRKGGTAKNHKGGS